MNDPISLSFWHAGLLCLFIKKKVDQYVCIDAFLEILMALSTSYICAIIVFNGKETLFFIWDWHHNLVYLNSNYNFKLQHFNIPCTPMDKDKRSIFNNVLFIFNNKFMNENFSHNKQIKINSTLSINCWLIVHVLHSSCFYSFWKCTFEFS